MQFNQPGPPDIDGVSDTDDGSDALEQRITEFRDANERQEWITREAKRIVLQRDAQRYADVIEHEDDRRPVRRTLTEQLEQPLEDELFSIEGLLPLGGSALFAGKYKAGKTTFNGQLLKAWVDGDPFLGQFECHPDPDKPSVTIFNYEMGESHFQRWLSRIGIINTDLVNVVHLRGLSLSMASVAMRREMAGWLSDAGTGLWVVDPASRAMVGAGDGSDNKDVSLFVSYLDEIKALADVRDLVLNIHMGHAAGGVDKSAERAIGAQAWSAWADALWFLTKDDKTGARFFHADGRDVAVDKQLVNYDAQTMGVKLVDIDPQRHAANSLREAILRVIENNPGIHTEGIKNEMRGLGLTIKNDGGFTRTLQELVQSSEVMMATRGKAKLYTLSNGQTPLYPPHTPHTPS